MTCLFCLASKTDIVIGHKHLTENVDFIEWGPQSAVCVPIKPFILGQSKSSTVPFIFDSGIQIPKENEIYMYTCRWGNY